MKNKRHVPLDVTSPEPDSVYGKVSFPTEIVEEQKVVTAIVNSRLDMAAMPRMKEEIDPEELRNLLFSIRDQNIYCPVCRCPEFGPSPLMRTTHYEGCTIGLMCEKLLRLYPRENYVVKWRK